MSDSPSATFASLGLRDTLVTALAALGYEAPTPIQERTIPILLEGRDLIGQAQTGTGKTAAFALPILERLDPEVKETQALILAPTRELAMQVAEAIHSYSRGMAGVTVLPVYGGAPIVLQMKHLARGAQIVVGTPGRLIDHLDRKTLDLSKVKFVVLDEADEMLKMGFVEDVERMLSLVPTPRQIALFSATMPEEVRRIAERHLINPAKTEVERKGGMAAPAIEQRFLNLSEGQKLEVLTQILELEPSEAALIFRRTKTGAAELAEKLEARGFAAVAMHGDMSQSLRESVIRRLRAGQIEIVVATDVAARGLDVEQISHVINYDVPNDVEAYVHRIGRTGRAGRSGVATLFITPRERRMMREIERFTGTSIKPMKLPTRADVAARRIQVFKENLRKNVQEGDLDLYVEVVQQLAEEGPYDMADIAAAAARLANGSRSLAAEAETRAPVFNGPVIREKSAPAPRPQSASTESYAAPQERDERPRPVASASFVPRADAPAYAPKKEFAPREPRSFDRHADDGEPKVRLSMAVGKDDGIRPADVVGSIANEADVPGRDIGPIDIRDEITYVVIPAKYLDQVLLKVGRARFRGRAVNIQLADGSSESTPPLRPYTPREGAPPRRFSRDDAPRRDFKGGAPKREFRPGAGAPPRREFSRDDAPRREFKPGGAGPKREFRPGAGAPPRRDFDRGPGGPPRRDFDRGPGGPPRAGRPAGSSFVPGRPPMGRPGEPGAKPFFNRFQKSSGPGGGKPSGGPKRFGGPGGGFKDKKRGR